MKQEVYRTYKYYDETGRRLSIFARHVNKDLQVYIYACSKADNFSKKFIREAHERSLIGEEPVEVHPQVTIIPIIDDKPYYSFIKYCNNNFLKKMTIKVTGLQDTLYTPNVTATFKKLIGPTRWLNKII